MQTQTEGVQERDIYTFGNEFSFFRHLRYVRTSVAFALAYGCVPLNWTVPGNELVSWADSTLMVNFSLPEANLNQSRVSSNFWVWKNSQSPMIQMRKSTEHQVGWPAVFSETLVWVGVPMRAGSKPWFHSMLSNVFHQCRVPLRNLVTSVCSVFKWPWRKTLANNRSRVYKHLEIFIDSNVSRLKIDLFYAIARLFFRHHEVGIGPFQSTVTLPCQSLK